MPGLVHINATPGGHQDDFLCEPHQSLREALRAGPASVDSRLACGVGRRVEV